MAFPSPPRGAGNARQHPLHLAVGQLPAPARASPSPAGLRHAYSAHGRLDQFHAEPPRQRRDRRRLYRAFDRGRSPLQNPTTWWPIEQDYFIDDYQFRREGPIPPRIDLKTGQVRVPDEDKFKGLGGVVPGGAATVLELPLQYDKDLRALTVTALANEVVVGLMSATLVR